jgi:hypothetical protein
LDCLVYVRFGAFEQRETLAKKPDADSLNAVVYRGASRWPLGVKLESGWVRASDSIQQ